MAWNSLQNVESYPESSRMIHSARAGGLAKAYSSRVWWRAEGRPMASELAEKIAGRLPRNGRKVGHVTPIRDLGVSSQDYYAAVKDLVEAGRAERGRGRGGALGLVVSGTSKAPAVDVAALDARRRELAAQSEKAEAEEERNERSLYPYLQRWAENEGYERVAITGDQKTRAPWENPDMLAVDTYDLEWVLGPYVEITAFEAKLSFETNAIWQAANYRRFSHFVYLACFEDADAIRGKHDGRLYAHCVELGLGILSLRTAGQGGKGVSCDEICAPRLQTPHPPEVDRLLDDYAEELKLPNPYRSIIQKGAK